MEDDYNWYEGGSRNGYGGMKFFEGSDRTTERRIKEYPDGTREIIETIAEKHVSSRWISAASDRQYKIGAASMERQNKSLTEQSTPLHNLLLARDAAIEGIGRRLPDFFPIKARK